MKNVNENEMWEFLDSNNTSQVLFRNRKFVYYTNVEIVFVSTKWNKIYNVKFTVERIRISSSFKSFIKRVVFDLHDYKSSLWTWNQSKVKLKNVPH